MLNNQRGHALIIIILMITVVVMLGSAALTLGSIVRKNAVMEVQQSRAYYTAEAGVEKALAEAKFNYTWLKTTVPYKPAGFAFTNNEKCLLSDNSHYPDPGDERVIESLRVIKINDDTKNNIVDLRIQSTGRSFQSRKSITVDARVTYAYPDLLFRGLWTDEMSTLSGGHGVDLQFSTFVSTEGLTIPYGADIAGNIFCNGNATLQDGNSTQGIVMSGDIISTGNVYLGNNTQLTGHIYIDNNHTVTFGNSVTLNGQIVVPGTTNLTGQVVLLSPTDLRAKMPPLVPEPLTTDRLNWYTANANFTSLPAKINNTYNFQNGVYYIEPTGGVLALEGKYAGQATLVVNGSVDITGDFTRTNSTNPPVDCLAILAAGAVQTQNATNYIDGFIYSKVSFGIENNTDVTGGIIAKKVDQINGNVVHIKQDSNMLNAYKDVLMNTTNFIKIMNWVD